MWVDQNEKLRISDLERILLDGLKLPSYCGGIIEVAKAFSIKHNHIDPEKIIDYAMELDIGAVIRRLGYLMELYKIGDQIHWANLRKKLTTPINCLTRFITRRAPHTAKWRLRLNISEDELVTVRGT